MTWLADFLYDKDADPAKLVRFPGGIGFRHGRSVTSHFVGHRVHYADGGELKPITLEFENGKFEGSPFGWGSGGSFVTYNGRELFKPSAVIFDGRRIPLRFLRHENELIADVGQVGVYKVVFTESGVREILVIPEPVDGLLEFDVQHAEKPGELHKRGRVVVGREDEGEIDSILLTSDMEFPVMIDPDYSGDTADSRVSGTNATYSTARSTATSHSNTLTYTTVGQATGYTCYRGALKFLTSGIPDTDTISAVTMTLVSEDDSSTTDFDVQIVKYDWSASDPIGVGNRDTVYDGILAGTLDDNIWRNTSGMSLYTQYVSGNLAVDWVSKTGATYYGLISSRDSAGTTPTNNEHIRISTQDNATSGYRPLLNVTHAASGWTNIAKVNGVASSTLAKVNAVDVANISKINGVSV